MRLTAGFCFTFYFRCYGGRIRRLRCSCKHSINSPLLFRSLILYERLLKSDYIRYVPGHIHVELNETKEMRFVYGHTILASPQVFISPVNNKTIHVQWINLTHTRTARVRCPSTPRYPAYSFHRGLLYSGKLRFDWLFTVTAYEDFVLHFFLFAAQIWTTECLRSSSNACRKKN
jgi:hypothetical protein